MPPDLVVHCPSQAEESRCRFRRDPIRLLAANPLQKERHPEVWPKDGTLLYLACPDCRLVSAHSDCKVVGFSDDQSKRHRGKVWLRLSFRCGVEGCNTPGEFHVLEDGTVTLTRKTELREKLNSGHWIGVLPCGHPISKANPKTLHFDIPGIMQGYNPNHQRWASI